MVPVAEAILNCLRSDEIQGFIKYLCNLCLMKAKHYGKKAVARLDPEQLFIHVNATPGTAEES